MRGDREHVREDRLQSIVRALLGRTVRLEEIVI